MEADIYEYESRFGGGNSSKKENKTPEITEKDIQKGAPQEFCGNETELLSSKTVSRIINVVDKKNWEAELVKPASFVCANIYDRFISNKPISKNERDYLISFFKKDITKKAAQEIVSKLNIQHGPENKDFIRSFLENEKGENVIVNPLRCILYNLENYPFVLDFDFDEITPVKYNVKYPVGGQYYEYKIGDKSGFVLKLDDKLYYLEATFNKIWLMGNGLIFGSVDSNEDADNKKEVIGEFYSFNMMGGFDFIYPARGITDVYFFEEGLLKSKGENGKFGLLEVTEKEENKETYKDKFEISEILDPSFDEIKSKHGFLLGFNREANYNYGKLEIFKYLRADLTHRHLKIKDSVSKLLDKDHVRYHQFIGGSIGVNFYEDGKIIDIENLDGHNFYSLNKDGGALVPIDGLQGFGVEYYSTLEGLFKGEPTFIENNADNTQSLIIFDEASQNFSKLVKGNNLQDGVGFLTLAKLGFTIFEDKKHSYVAYNDGSVFCLKPGYKAYHKNPTSSFCIVEKGFFKNKDLGFIYTKEELLNYADLVLPENLPIIIK